ncbi:MAG: hypothetical protein ACFE85_13210 [Candidatus Hodarchaeota archaeon]
MEKIESEKNSLIQSQKTLYIKLKRINQLFKVHFWSLTLLFLSALGFSILWTYLLVIGQITTDLSQRYGLFGTFVTIFIITVLFLLIIQLGIQMIFYSLFIIRGNRSLKQAKVDKKAQSTLYDGIIPYITNFYAFFKRYSKEKTSLIKLVTTFLFLNFFSGFYITFLSTRILDAENANFLINIFSVILFLSMMTSWLINLMTSIKIRNEIVKWEKLFPKLEEWAQEVEQFSEEKSIFFHDEVPP